MIKIPFTTESTKFEKGLAKMRQNSKEFTNDVAKDLTSGRMGWMKYGLAIGAVEAATKGLTSFVGGLVSKSFDFGKKITAQAAEAKAGVEELQTILELAFDAGTQEEQVIAALKNVNTRSVDALNGMESYQKAFARLNIDWKTFAELPAEKKLEMIARGYKSSGKTAQSYRDILTLLGEDAGPKMIKVLDEMANQGFDKLNDKMIESGRIVKNEVVEVLEDARKSMDELQKSAGTLTTELLGSMGAILGFGDKGVSKIARAEFFDNLTHGMFGFADKAQKDYEVTMERNARTKKRAKTADSDLAEFEKQLLEEGNLTEDQVFSKSLRQELDLKALEKGELTDSAKSKGEAFNKEVAQLAKQGFGILKNFTDPKELKDEDLGKFENKSKKSMVKMQKVAVSSLAAIGGGGGVSNMNPTDEIKKSNQWLEQIANYLKPKEGAPKNSGGTMS